MNMLITKGVSLELDGSKGKPKKSRVSGVKAQFTQKITVKISTEQFHSATSVHLHHFYKVSDWYS